MRNFNTGRVQDTLINQLDRKEKQKAFQRDRFLQYKLSEINTGVTEALLVDQIIETDNSGTLSDLILRGFKKLARTNEFDYKYFIAPIRGLVPRANPISLFITQYILEVIINDPCIIDIYGTDEDIYKTVNRVITKSKLKFDAVEKKIHQELAKNKALAPGSRDYDIALDQLFHKAMGDIQIKPNNPRK
jgi:hypothetical protein